MKQLWKRALNIVFIGRIEGMVIEYFMMTFMGIHRHSSSSRSNRGKSRRAPGAFEN